MSNSALDPLPTATQAVRHADERQVGRIVPVADGRDEVVGISEDERACHLRPQAIRASVLGRALCRSL